MQEEKLRVRWLKDITNSHTRRDLQYKTNKFREGDKLLSKATKKL